MPNDPKPICIEASTTTCPLAQLVLAPENVRQARPHKSEIREMADTFRTHGMHAPLLVYPLTDGEGYAVFAGHRRLAALQLLCAENALAADAPIPIITRDQCHARELSLVENIKRRAMHPAEEYSAFNDLLKDGATLAEVATRFGCTVEHVRRIQRLARVHRSIFARFRKNTLSLDQMMAYALTDEVTAQKAVFDLVGPDASVHRIRQALTEGMSESTSKIARFVTMATYQAAGGPVREDLFSEQRYCCDAALLQQLAQTQLDAESERLRSSGWGWVEVSIDSCSSYDYPHRLSGQRTVPDDLTQQHETLTDTLAALDDQLATDSEDDTATVEAAFNDAEQALLTLEATIDALPVQYDPAEMKLAGCVIGIDHKGCLQVIDGVVHKEDMALIQRLQQGEKPNEDADNNTVADTARISGPLARDLGRIRRSAIRQAMVEQPKAAIVVLHFQLVDAFLCGQLSHYRPCASVLSLSPKVHTDDIAADEPPAWLSDSPYTPLLESLPIEAWTSETTPVERFGAFVELRTRERNALIALAIAATLEGGQSASEQDALMDRLSGELLGVDFAARYRPDARYFSRLTKAQLLDLGAQFWGASFSHYSHEKKSVLVKRLERLFHPATDESTLSAHERELREHWLPAQIG